MTARVVHDVRLVPAALLSWLGAWWAVASPPEHGRAASTGLLVTGAAVLVLLAARRAVVGVRAGRWLGATAALVVTTCAVPGLVLGLTSWHAERRAPAVVVDVAARSGTVVADLVVTGAPVPATGSVAWQREQVRVRVVLEHVTVAGQARQVRVPASVSASEEDLTWAEARWGERLRVTLALEQAPVGAPVTVFARPVGEARQLSGPRWWWRAAEQLRGGLLVASGATDVSRPERAGPGDGAALLPGLVVGDTSAQDESLVQDMRTAGLTHLTAVSGANVSIVCGGVLLLCVLLRVGRRGGAVLAGLALVALVVVARPDPSVLRAAVMGSVGLLGILLGRRGGGVSAVALAVVAVLLADPWLARAPGFRLSVLATTALVLCAMPWARATGRVLPRSVAVALAVPAAAQAGVTPALVGLEPVVSLYALPANVLAAPAVAPATVIGVVAALLSVVHPGLAALVATPATWCAAWIALLARHVAGLPAASVPWPEGAAGVVSAVGATALTVSAAALVLRLLPDRRREGEVWAPWPGCEVPLTGPDLGTVHRAGPAGAAGGAGPPRRRGPPGRARGVLVLVVVVSLTSAWLWPHRAGSRWPGDDWAVVVCDVGQGESVLVRAGPDAAVVVDTGPDPAPVAACLRRAGVAAVPLVVLTHLHADHVGGLDGVARAADVGQVWSTPAGMPRSAEADLVAWTAEQGVGLQRPSAGTAARVGTVRVDVLAPSAAAAAGPRVGDSQDVNDAGLVVRLDTGEISLLALGDIGSQVQAALLATGRTAGQVGGAGPMLAADVTTVAHHGSADQLVDFYEAVGARLAVASAGRDNSYGHPSPRAVQVVSAAGTRVVSTAQHGDVAVRAAGDDRAGDDRAGDDPDADDPDADDPARGGLAVRTTRAAPRRRSHVPA